MIAARAHRIAQSGKPGALDERGVKRELSAGDAAGIEHIDVVRIALQFDVFQFLGLLYQLLDALLLRRIGGTVREPDEVVVGVIAGVHRAHAIQLPHLNRGEQVIHGKGIVRMSRQDPLEILNRRVVVEVVVALESRLVQRVGRTKIGGMEISLTKRHGVCCQTRLGKDQQHDGSQSGAMPGEEEKHAQSV